MKTSSTFYYVIFLLIGTPNFLNAQKVYHNQISISSGSSIMARQDLIYSPYVHSDKSLLSFGAKYQRDKKMFQYINSNFSYNSSQIGKPQKMEMNDHNHMFQPHEYLFINATYGIGKSIKETSQSKNWIGGALKADLQAAFYNFHLSEMFGYFIDHSANAWFRHTNHFGKKHQLSIHIELPIISWMARPPYLAEDDTFIENISSHNKSKILREFIKDGKWTTWNKLQRVNLDLEYSYPISDKFNIGANYRFIFLHSKEPKTLLSYQNNFNFHFTFNF